MGTSESKKLSTPSLSRRSGGTLSTPGESNKVSPRLSLEPYKGTRDFYPKDQFVQNYIFSIWRKVCEIYGYLEYGASILEETELYKAKTGEEIVNEQTYSFVDRGGRSVTIRPEITPTVARMVAGKRKELIFPLRWYSIPNLLRYERPQRGRLREHWQLNADIFGIESLDADVEIIRLAYDIMKAFGAKDSQFEIHVNSRKFLNYLLLNYLWLNEKETYVVSKLIDRRQKMPKEEFEKQSIELLKDKAQVFKKVLAAKSIMDLPQDLLEREEIIELNNFINTLADYKITNVKFTPSLVRGFDYYTGIVFEMFDTNPKNPRALFGGGRYDDLVSIFGVDKVPGVGFGWGDVTTRDFLETYNLLPEYKPPIDLYICHLDGYQKKANQLATNLRQEGINVAVDLTDKKVSAQVKTADKQNIPFVLVVGEEEVKSGKFKVKRLKDFKEILLGSSKIASFIKKSN